jgi:hypothetical protein
VTDPPTPPTDSDADASPSADGGPGGGAWRAVARKFLAAVMLLASRVKGVVGHPIVLKVLAAVMLLAPVAGIAWHAYVYLQFDVDAVIAYGASVWVKASAGLVFVLLVVNWFHYRHTRWTVDLVSRVLLYCWAVSMALLWVRVRNP